MPIANGLPLGLQLTADLGQDSRVLQAALLLQLRFNAGPKISQA
jgi:Asp-tRNA(Asn)/Glu-tRNA(Gln) amidotransferase A subunit family amidase